MVGGPTVRYDQDSVREAALRQRSDDNGGGRGHRDRRHRVRALARAGRRDPGHAVQSADDPGRRDRGHGRGVVLLAPDRSGALRPSTVPSARSTSSVPEPGPAPLPAGILAGSDGGRRVVDLGLGRRPRADPHDRGAGRFRLGGQRRRRGARPRDGRRLGASVAGAGRRRPGGAVLLGGGLSATRSGAGGVGLARRCWCSLCCHGARPVATRRSRAARPRRRSRRPAGSRWRAPRTVAMPAPPARLGT